MSFRKDKCQISFMLDIHKYKVNLVNEQKMNAIIKLDISNIMNLQTGTASDSQSRIYILFEHWI